jgi:hypothetical protein
MLGGSRFVAQYGDAVVVVVASKREGCLFAVFGGLHNIFLSSRKFSLRFAYHLFATIVKRFAYVRFVPVVANVLEQYSLSARNLLILGIVVAREFHAPKPHFGFELAR